ncbi:MAG: hypothetical protein WBA57_20425 [Elainellaceae cyanobacterium]
MTLTTFSPHQIICLEHHYNALYAESIQMIHEKQQVWARPIVLAILPSEFHGQYPKTTLDPETASGSYSVTRHPEAIPWLYQATLWDLRSGSDLLWPIHFFRPALDTEMIPIMTQLGEPKQYTEGDRPAGHTAFQQFIRTAWHAYAAHSR